MNDQNGKWLKRDGKLVQMVRKGAKGNIGFYLVILVISPRFNIFFQNGFKCSIWLELIILVWFKLE